MNSRDNESKSRSEHADVMAFPLFIGLVILGFYLIFVLVLFVAGFVNNVEYTAKLGDSLGVATAFFSGYAAYLVFLTLKAQRKELSDTRDELMRTRVSQEKSSVEVTFLQLMSVHKDNLDRLVEYRPDGSSTRQGGKVIEQIYSQIVSCFRVETNRLRPEHSEYKEKDYYLNFGLLTAENQSIVLDRVRVLLEASYRLHGVYFRHLLNLLNFLDRNRDVLGSDIEFLASVLSANLGEKELIVLNFLRLIFDEKTSERIKSLNLLEGLDESSAEFREIDLQVPFYKS